MHLQACTCISIRINSRRGYFYDPFPALGTLGTEYCGRSMVSRKVELHRRLAPADQCSTMGHRYDTKNLPFWQSPFRPFTAPAHPEPPFCLRETSFSSSPPGKSLSSHSTCSLCIPSKKISRFFSSLSFPLLPSILPPSAASLPPIPPSFP